MNIWVHSPHIILAESLMTLVQKLGLEVSLERSPACDVALWDLTGSHPPYPKPSSLPTLALISGSEEDAVSLLQLRYRGYLSSDDGGDTLKLALQAVRRGEIWADRQTLTRVIDGFPNPALTAKEQEVFHLLVQGLSNRIIGEELGIKEGTVKMHVSRLFSKLDVRSRTELIVQFMDR